MNQFISHHRVWTACLGLAAIVGLTSCGRDRASVQDPTVLARVGETVITQADFQRELDRRADNGQRVSSDAERRAVLDYLVRGELIFAKARSAGYDRDPELLQQFKRSVAAKFEQEEWEKFAAPEQPNQAEIESYYAGHTDEFTSLDFHGTLIT